MHVPFMRMIDVHAPNKEKFTQEFDPVAEQARLQRLTGDETVQVIMFVDGVACVVSKGGRVQLVDERRQPEEAQVALADQYIVRYWKGKVWNAKYNRKGAPFDFGPYQIKFYHPDRVAEVLRKHKEST
jgi:hypothetical protein